MRASGKAAGSPVSHRLYWNTRNRTYIGHIKRFRNGNLKKTAGWAWQVNEEYIQEHQIKAVEVVSSEQLNVEETEMDEMWSFVHDKSQQYWLWWLLIIILVFLWRIALVRVSTSIWMNCWCYLPHSTLKQSMRTVIMPIKSIFMKAPLLQGRETRSVLNANIFLFVPGAADWLGRVSVFRNSILCIEL